MNHIHMITIGEMFKKTTELFPKRAAMEYIGRYWTYEELDHITDCLAFDMIKKGITKGVKVAMWAKNSPNAIFYYISLEKIGAIPVMLHMSWKIRTVQEYLSRIDVQHLFYDDGDGSNEHKVLVDKINISHGVEKEYIGMDFNVSDKYINVKLDDGEKEVLNQAMQSVVPEDTDIILFTSGSTGKPKGVVTTHYGRINNAIAHAQVLHITQEDVLCVVPPMFHCCTLTGNIMTAFCTGACISLPKSNRTKDIFETISRTSATVLTAVPTIYSSLLASKWRTEYNYDSLRVGLLGGAGYSSKFFFDVQSVLGMKLIPAFGMTEATAIIAAGDYDDYTDESAKHVGKFLSNVEGKIIDRDTGERVPKGIIGEICIKGYSVMKGYYRQVEETNQAIDEEGFLHTGDLGYFDEYENLYITGRCKEIIIRGGENIYPGEIENVIQEIEGVRNVKVFGVPDEHYGEEICACLSLVDEKRVEDDFIKKYVGENLANYKMPRYVLKLQELPLMDNGKIDLNKIREIFEKKEFYIKRS